MYWEQHSVFVIGAILSIALLTTFMVFQYHQSDLLNLESRWLLVAAVPLLASLVIGGYIKSFKGFGVELEANLKEPVKSLDLSAAQAMVEVQGDEKRSIEYLRNLSVDEKVSIERLVLVQGRHNYYRPGILQQYLEELSGLKYIEIKAMSGSFVALMPIAEFKINGGVNNLNEFVRALEESKILLSYPLSVITPSVKENVELLELLVRMRSEDLARLVVIDKKGVFKGLLTLAAVEKRIVDDVVAAKEKY